MSLLSSQETPPGQSRQISQATPQAHLQEASHQPSNKPAPAPPLLKESQADVWYLKPITYGAGEFKKDLKIITQNFNGPCSFIAICNILILRGNIEILPANRKSVSYELLSQLVGEYLLTRGGDVDISAALSMMPSTTKGMDLNPLFTGATSFRPAGDGGELKLFEQAGIQLVHGWLVDPDSPEAAVVKQYEDYDAAVNLIADADHTAHGQLVVDDVVAQAEASGSSSHAGSSHPGTNYTPEETQKIENAITIRSFLIASQTQLTYHGLFTLSSHVEPGTLVALFRSSHLSVLYKSPIDSSLYILVSDSVFLREHSIVWERLEDVDGGLSTFVDGDFVMSNPVGGDWAGETAESTLRAFEAQNGQLGEIDPADQALAMQLQQEEDQHAQQMYDRRQREREQRRLAERDAAVKKQFKPKEKNKCIIM